MNVYVIQADFCVQNVAHITSEEEWNAYLKNLTIHGRSGTDFRPVFAYVEELRKKKELKNLKGLLYFTDGDGIYPEAPTNYETAFVFYREKEQHQKVPSWAVTLKLEGESYEY
jgi:predicted metal-dependent peptidase